MRKKYTLCDARLCKWVTVSAISSECPILRRLYDIGLVQGTRVKCLYSSVGGGMRAYLIRGAVIALRDGDCAYISVFEEDDTNETE